MVKPTVEKNKPKITLWPFLNINFRCSNVYTTNINKGNSAGNSSMLSKNSPSINFKNDLWIPQYVQLLAHVCTSPYDLEDFSYRSSWLDSTHRIFSESRCSFRGLFTRTHFTVLWKLQDGHEKAADASVFARVCCGGIWSGAEVCKSMKVVYEKSEKAPTLAIRGVDTAENEPRSVLKLMSSADFIISIISLVKGKGCWLQSLAFSMEPRPCNEAGLA